MRSFSKKIKSKKLNRKFATTFFTPKSCLKYLKTFIYKILYQF